MQITTETGDNWNERAKRGGLQQETKTKGGINKIVKWTNSNIVSNK